MAGPAGAGKTTLASALSSTLALPHIEIDAIYHGPGWTPRPTFEAEVDEFSSRAGWITEWQYTAAREVLAQRAELLIHLQYRRPVVTRRVVVRTLRRRLLREQLWNGNVEPPLRTILTDPEHIVRWSWQRHDVVPRLVDDARLEHPGLMIVELRSPSATAGLLRALRAGGTPERENAPESSPGRS